MKKIFKFIFILIFIVGSGLFLYIKNINHKYDAVKVALTSVESERGILSPTITLVYSKLANDINSTDGKIDKLLNLWEKSAKNCNKEFIFKTKKEGIKGLESQYFISDKKLTEKNYPCLDKAWLAFINMYK